MRRGGLPGVAHSWSEQTWSCAPLQSSALSKTLSLSLSVLTVAYHSVATATTATYGSLGSLAHYLAVADA